MKAWQIAKDIIDGVEPRIVLEENESWTMSEFQKHEENKIMSMWRSVAPGSGAPSSLITGAVQSMENMGYDVADSEEELQKGFIALEQKDTVALMKTTQSIFSLLNNAEADKASDYWRFKIYNSYDEFKVKCSFPENTEVDVNSESYRKAVNKSWVGQIAGGAFGTAIEGYTRENIKKSFGKVTGYLKKPCTYNDDITYELAFLAALEKRGKQLKAKDIASEWVGRIPFGWSAEDIALKNLMLGIDPPQSGCSCNPYREWIGAQMRGAVCGLVAPGNPQLAAELAWMDGGISHHNSGIIGEAFNAVLTSMAFVEKDARSLLEKVIAMLPKDCQYYDVVKYALDKCRTANDYEEALISCEKKFEEYNLTHAFPNAAIEVAALWFGEGKFDRTMEIAAAAGMDVDCNTAQLGSIVSLIDKNDINESWTEPLENELMTYVRGFEKIQFDSLTDLTVEGAKKIR